MQTRLDDPVGDMNDYETRLLGAVREHGFQSTHVMEGEGEPCFTYTIGFWLTLQHPELILFGLPQQIAHDIVWDVFRMIEAGKPPTIGAPVDDVIKTYPVYFLPLSEKGKEEHLLSAKWFYKGADIPCLQLVWPDRNGVFPWNPRCDEGIRDLQPDVTEAGWTL